MTALEYEVQGIAIFKCQQLAVPLPSDWEYPIKEVEQAILNYCNICAVPRDLRFIWANMIIDYLRWMDAVRKANEANSDGGPGGAGVATFASSIKQGDTTVGFTADASAVSNKATAAHNLGEGDDGILDKVVMNYTDALNKFRRVVWGSVWP